MQFELAGKFILEKLKNELPACLSYHSVYHVKDVYAAAAHLAGKEGLTPYETQLLLTAAWYHDSGFIKGAKDHEEESCRIAREALPGFGYNDAEITLICGMIMATKIPQSPHNHLEEILADADLDYLGRIDFYIISDKLFVELKASGVLTFEEEWNLSQIQFLENHRYFTKTANASRNERKANNLATLKMKVKQETTR